MENIHTGDSHTPNPYVYDTHNDGGPLGKTPKSFRSHTAKHVGPLPASLTESCCTLSALCTHVRDNNMENIHTGASHAPTQDVYDTHNDGGPLGKTPKSFRSHTAKHVGPLPASLTESCCTLSALCTHVRDNNMENIHTGASHAPTPDVYDTHNDGGPLGKTPKSFSSHTAKHVGPLPRPLTESCCTLSALCTNVRENNMENTHTGASHAPTPDVYDTHNDGGPLGKTPKSVHSPVRSHTVKHEDPLPRSFTSTHVGDDNMENIHTGASHAPTQDVYDTHNDGGPLGKTPKSFRSHTAEHVGPLPASLTESCCTLSALCTHVRDNNMENIHTGASHAPTQDVYDTHNDGGPLGKIPESVGSSVRSHTVKHVGPLPRPCGPELSKSWPHLDHRQASAHRSSVHHRPQCATMLPRRSPRDCNDFPGFRHHVGDVNQAQCRRAYSRQLVSFNGGRRTAHAPSIVSKVNT